MADQRTDASQPADAADATDSHAPATKPRGSARTPRARRDSQKALAVLPPVPLHERPVLDYAELAALGVIPERTLRRLVAVGRVKRAVLHVGRRGRFVVRDLLDELREAGE
jgi:hypothetical protein